MPLKAGMSVQKAGVEMCCSCRNLMDSDPLCSLEVGVRAEAYQEEGPNRHINSAFMTFEVLDKSGKPCNLPRIRPEPVVSLQTKMIFGKHQLRMQTRNITYFINGL